MTTKFAVCAFYLRVFTDRTSKIIIWAMFAFIAVFSVPLLFALIFRCHPIKGTSHEIGRSYFVIELKIIGAWSMTPADCASQLPPLYSSAILNIFADVGLLSFVIPRIGELAPPNLLFSLTDTPSQSPHRQKAKDRSHCCPFPQRPRHHSSNRQTSPHPTR